MPFRDIDKKNVESNKKNPGLKKRFELEGNEFVFAIKGNKQMHVRGNKAFENISKKMKTKNITAGKIRKVAGTNNVLDKDDRKRKL